MCVEMRTGTGNWNIFIVTFSFFFIQFEILVVILLVGFVNLGCNLFEIFFTIPENLKNYQQKSHRSLARSGVSKFYKICMYVPYIV